MNKIINGKRYDTGTAKKVAEAYAAVPANDFGWWHEELFLKRTGEYFLRGEGGPMSRYARTVGHNEWAGGEKIIPLSYDKAREWAEQNLDTDEYEAEFGEVTEDETRTTLSISLPASTADAIRRQAQEAGVSISSLIAGKFETGMVKYIALDENDLGMDQLIGVYDDLQSANAAAIDAHGRLALRDEAERHIYVLDVKKADLDDPDDWTSFTAGGYCDGRFDSHVWYAVQDSEDESHDHGDGYWLLDEAIESAKAQNDSFPGRFFVAVVDPRDDYCTREIHADEF